MEIKFAFKLLPIQNGLVNWVYFMFTQFFQKSVSFYKGFIFSSFDMKPYNKLLLFGRVFNTKLPFIMRGRFSFNLRILGELYEKLWNIKSLRFPFYSIFFAFMLIWYLLHLLTVFTKSQETYSPVFYLTVSL